MWTDDLRDATNSERIVAAEYGTTTTAIRVRRIQAQDDRPDGTSVVTVRDYSPFLRAYAVMYMVGGSLMAGAGGAATFDSDRQVFIIGGIAMTGFGWLLLDLAGLASPEVSSPSYGFTTIPPGVGFPE